MISKEKYRHRDRFVFILGYLTKTKSFPFAMLLRLPSLSILRGSFRAKGTQLQRVFTSLSTGASPKIKEVKLIPPSMDFPTTLEVHWDHNVSDTVQSRFLDLWLLDNCPEFRDPETTQKTISTAEIQRHSSRTYGSVTAKNHDSLIHSARLLDDKATIEVEWKRDDIEKGFREPQTTHKIPSSSRFSATFLFENCGSRETFTKLNGLRGNTSESTSVNTSENTCLKTNEKDSSGYGIPQIDISEILENSKDPSCGPSKDGLFKWMNEINTNGICLLRNVHGISVGDVGSWVGPLMHTIYPDIFDVRSEENPINIAYTPKSLRLHQDMPYYESPPFLQLLHCIRFDKEVVGGESTFLDTFLVAEEFRRRYPKEFMTLTKLPCLFQKNHVNRENPVRLFYRRPHIQLNERDEFIAMYWSPPFEGPFRGSDQDVKAYYDAYALLNETIEELLVTQGIKIRLQEGDIIAFNQRRMLHGREAFSLQRVDSESHADPKSRPNSPADSLVRHLQGCYIGLEPFLTRFANLKCEIDSFPMDHPGIKFGDSALPRKGFGSFD